MRDPTARRCHVHRPGLRRHRPRQLHRAGRLQLQDEVAGGVLVLHGNAVGDSAGVGTDQGVQGAQPDGAGGGGPPQRGVGWAVALPGVGGAPGCPLHGVQTAEQHQAPVPLLTRRPARRRRHVSHGQVGVTDKANAKNIYLVHAHGRMPPMQFPPVYHLACLCAIDTYNF